MREIKLGTCRVTINGVDIGNANNVMLYVPMMEGLNHPVARLVRGGRSHCRRYNRLARLARRPQ